VPAGVEAVEGCGCGAGRVDRVRLLPSHWLGFAHVAQIIQMSVGPCDTWRVTLGYADLEEGIACLGGMDGEACDFQRVQPHSNFI
jgi:hypothetical protein